MTHSIVTLIACAIPFCIAVGIDRELSSPLHLPIMGITGLCVSLCDALCGQIISNTKWIPFSACHKPAEAQELVRLFKSYHRRMILEWMGAKLTSAAVVVLTAVMALQKCPEALICHRFSALTVGYVLLGLSIAMAISFVVSYFSASDEFDRARLEEMNYAYKKEHPELYSGNSEDIKKQLEGFAAGYTLAPTTITTE